MHRLILLCVCGTWRKAHACTPSPNTVNPSTAWASLQMGNISPVAPLTSVSIYGMYRYDVMLSDWTGGYTLSDLMARVC